MAEWGYAQLGGPQVVQACLGGKVDYEVPLMYRKQHEIMSSRQMIKGTIKSESSRRGEYGKPPSKF